MIEVASEFVVVGVERDHNPCAVHQRSVERYGINDLDLISPPIRKSGSHGAMPGHLIGDLISLENVLQSSDSHTVLFERSQKGQDLVLPVTMAVDPAAMFQNVDDRFELEVATRRQALATRGARRMRL